MTNKEKLTKINNELKVYINESSFISMKCRNKVLKYLAEDFNVNLDIDNYQNVDVKIKEDGTIVYRGDKYKSNDDRGTMVIFGINTDLDEKTEIQFRRSTNKYPSLVIELMLQSKMARGGKGVSIVKQKLGIPNNNSYFMQFKSNEELFEYLSNNGFSF